MTSFDSISAPHTISVVSAVFTRSNQHGTRQVLAFLLGPCRDTTGLWEVTGGKIEPGETPEQALASEMHEEPTTSTERDESR